MKSVILRSLYDGYDVYSDTVGRLGTDQVLRNCNDVLIHEAELTSLPISTVGPAYLNPLEVLLSPQIHFARAKHTLREIAIGEVPNLVRLSFRQTQDPEYLGKVAIRTVFGGTEEMPLRALSYLLPALHFVESLKHSGKFLRLPQIQFIMMSETGIVLNNLDGYKVKEQANLFIRIANQYIQEFYPELVGHVVFATDEGFLENNNIREMARFLVDNIKPTQNGLYSLVMGGLGRFGHDNSLLYAALHPLVHDINFPDNLFIQRVGVLNAQPEMVINIGGQSEKLFYKARCLFRDSLTQAGVALLPSVQLFSCHKAPPYMRMRTDGIHDKDILLEEALKDPSQISLVVYQRDGENNILRRDLKLLIDDTHHAIFDFLEREGNH